LKGNKRHILLDAGTEEVLAFFVFILSINDVSHCIAFICTFITVGV
jgi:hypothetical protein